MNEKELMKLDMVKELSLLLIENGESTSIEEALSEVLNSETYERLSDENTHLYYQSPYYVYSFLENELKTGQVM
ncbi:MAG: hypothetical protein IKO99_05635 [Bacteroidales bacterium]|nr:hypothetical protein [Bacteroidales bacterium]MCR4561405.1 hypothetical protein [Bacteroidales bacterium]MEE3447406.1 hypothetical protein [Bacteroidales bacterium]